MDEKETLKTSEKPDAPEVSDEALDQINGGKWLHYRYPDKFQADE